MHHEEIIGADIKIIESKNQAHKGVEGKLIDETKNTLTLKIKGKTGDKHITIAKEQCTFEITTKKSRFTAKGSELIGRPEERMKKHT